VPDLPTAPVPTSLATACRFWTRSAARSPGARPAPWPDGSRWHFRP